jgi:peptidoglycan L-alanyl-D-glutamate endopeptidase CwlK
MPTFGTTSAARLATCEAPLQELCRRIVTHLDITILFGHRTEAEQEDAYRRGASTKRWPESKHNRMPALAVDAAPWPIPANWGDTKSSAPAERDLEWKERVKFYELAAIARFVWAQMVAERPELAARYRLRLGADWDGDGDYRDNGFDDLPHIELVEVQP